MPQIQEFDAGNLEIRPQETGAEAFAQAGRRIGVAFREVGERAKQVGGEFASIAEDKEKHVTRDQVSKISAATSKAVADAHEELNRQYSQSDPNDTGVSKRFFDSYWQPKIKELGEMATTRDAQDWAARYLTQHDTMIREMAVAEDSVRAGHAFVLNAHARQVHDERLAAEGGITVLPGLIEGEDLTREIIIHNSPQVSVSDRAKFTTTMKEEHDARVAQAAFRGDARRDPDKALADLEAGRYDKYLRPGEADQLRREYKIYKRMDETEQRERGAATRRENEQNALDRQNEYLEGVTGPDGRIDRSLIPGIEQKVWTDPVLGQVKGAKASTLRLLNQGDKIISKDDSRIAMTSIMPRVLSDDPPSDKELWSHAGEDMSIGQVKQLIEIAHGTTPEMKAAKEVFNMGRATVRQWFTGLINDPAGTGAGLIAFGDWQMWAQGEFFKRVRAGENPAKVMSDLRSEDVISQFTAGINTRIQHGMPGAEQAPAATSEQTPAPVKPQMSTDDQWKKLQEMFGGSK